MPSYLHNTYDLDDPAIVSVLDETPLWSAPFGLRLLDTVRLASGITALDVGCGLGFPLFELAARLGPRSAVHGLDPWPGGLERARRKCEVYGVRNVSIVEGVAEKMPFEDATFDLIVSNNGLNNVSDIRQSLRECRRVAKPGAQLVFTMNLDTTMHEFYSIFAEVLQNNALPDALDALRAHIYTKRKPLEEIQTFVQEAGFTITRVQRDEFSLRYLDGTTMLNHFWIQLAFLDGWRSAVPAEHEQDIFEQVEAELNRVAATQGEVRLSVPFVTVDCGTA